MSSIAPPEPFLVGFVLSLGIISGVKTTSVELNRHYAKDLGHRNTAAQWRCNVIMDRAFYFCFNVADTATVIILRHYSSSPMDPVRLAL